MKKIFSLFVFITIMTGVAHAQGLSSFETKQEKLEDKKFVSQEIDATQPWGMWLKDVYMPYSEEVSAAILKLISSTSDIDRTGKTSEQLLEDVNKAFNRSLKAMELIQVPVELNDYHSKIVEIYKITINADPKEAAKNAVMIKQLTREADQALTEAFQSHKIPQHVIDSFTTGN